MKGFMSSLKLRENSTVKMPIFQPPSIRPQTHLDNVSITKADTKSLTSASQIAVKVNWVNGPKDQQTLSLICEKTTTVKQFRQNILAVLQEEGEEERPWTSADLILESPFGGFFLSKREDYLCLDDLDNDLDHSLSPNYTQNRVIQLFLLTHGQGFAFCSAYSLNSFKIANLILDLSWSTISSLISELSTLEDMDWEDIRICVGDGYGDCHFSKSQLDKDGSVLRRILGPYMNSKIYYYSFPTPVTLQIMFWKSSGLKAFEVSIYLAASVEELKQLVLENSGVLCSQQRLFFGGKELKGELRKLCCFRLHDSATLQLVRKPKDFGKGHRGQEQKNLAVVGKEFRNRNYARMSFKEYLPGGLNILGICGNEGCPSYGKRVFASLGFGNFHLTKDQDLIICPGCKKSLPQILAIILINTHWRSFGRRWFIEGINKRDGSQRTDLQQSSFPRAEEYVWWGVMDPTNKDDRTGEWETFVIQTAASLNLRKGIILTQPTHCLYCFQKFGTNEPDWNRAIYRRYVCHRECVGVQNMTGKRWFPPSQDAALDWD